MKRFYQILLIALFVSILGVVNGQIVKQFNYQAVVRTSDGSIMQEQEILVKFTIENESGTEYYIEEQEVTSDIYGVINISVGDGNLLSGLWTAINWSDDLLLTVDIDYDKDGTFDLNGTNAINSVPKANYAIKANVADNLSYPLAQIATSGDYTDLANKPLLILDGDSLSLEGSNKIHIPGMGRDSLILQGNRLSILGSNSVTLPSTSTSGSGDMRKSQYDANNDGSVDEAQNAHRVNNLTVGSSVPEGAIFTDEQTAAEVPVVANTTLGLTSVNVQQALEELQGEIGDMPDDIQEQLDTKVNLSLLSNVATSGDYDDLVNKPLNIDEDKTDDLLKSDLVNDLTTGGITEALAAEQGKVLKDALDQKALATNVYTKTEADNLLLDKVDVEIGKGLSTNDYSDTDKTKVTGAEQVANKNAADGYPGLDGNKKIDISQLPAITVNNVYTVADNSELASLASSASQGDVAIDIGSSKNYIHNGGDAGNLTDWTELASPNVEVTSVNGKTGNVVIGITDIATLQTELSGKANSSDLSTIATSGSYDDLLDIPTNIDLDATNDLLKSDIINDLISGGTDKVLSAEQGKLLKDALDQKIAATNVYTKTETDNILNTKVDIEVGKGLSENDYTDVEKALVSGAEQKSNKNLANGYAGLDENAKIAVSQLPAITVNSVFSVASEAEQTALTAVQGDIVIRTDISKNYIHNGGTSGTISDWTELAAPNVAVTSVNGKTGDVMVAISDIALLQAELDSKANLLELADVATTGSYNDLQDLPANIDTEATDDLLKSDIVDDLTTGGSDKVLSAEQGKILKTDVDDNTDAIGTNSTNISTNSANIALNATKVALADTASDLRAGIEAANTAGENLQTELDDTQTGAGLGDDGSYTANTSTNYMISSTSLVDATEDLDAQVKINADSVAINAAAIENNADNISDNTDEIALLATQIALEDTTTAVRSALVDSIAAVRADAFNVDNLTDTYVPYLNGTGLDDSPVTVSNDKVGIGTTNTVGKVSINSGSTNIGLNVKNSSPFDNTDTNLDGAGLVFHSAQTDNNGFLSNIVATGTSNGNWSSNLAFWTASYNPYAFTEKMRITRYGNVGIGTTAPSEKLDVAGNIKAAGKITVDSVAVNDMDLVPFKQMNDSLAATSSAITSNLAYKYVPYYNGSALVNSPVAIRDNSKFGFNEPNPITNFHIKFGDSGRAWDLNDHALFIEDDINARITLAGTNGSIIDFGDGKFPYQAAIKYSSVDKALTFHNYLSSEKMRIDSTGNVGINQVSPTEKLAVGGNIKATGKVTAGANATANMDLVPLAQMNDLLAAKTSAITNNLSSGYLPYTVGSNLENSDLNQNINGLFFEKDGLARMSIKSYTETVTGGALLYLNRARGTKSSKSGTQDGDTFGSIIFSGAGSTGGEQIGGTITMTQEGGEVSGSYRPANMSFYTANGPLSSDNRERLTILSTGNIGIGRTAPTEKLDVAGNIKATGKVTAGANASADMDLVPFKQMNDSLAARTSGITSNLSSSYMPYYDGTGLANSPATITGSRFGFNVANPTTSFHIKFGDSGQAWNITDHNLLVEDSNYARLTLSGANGSYISLTDGDEPSWSRIIYTSSDKSLAFFNDKTEKMRISSSGNVGIGKAGPSEKLDVAGNIKGSGTLTIAGNLAMGAGNYINADGDAEGLSFDADGKGTFSTDLTVNGNTYFPSDRRLKTNIETLSDVMDKINQIRGVRFEYKDQTKYATGPKIGVIAQELQEVYPELVTEGDDGYLKVDYTQLTGILLQAVKEQQKEIDTLKQQMETVMKKLGID